MSAATALKNRKQSYKDFGLFDQVKDGVLRKVTRGTYNTATGVYPETNTGQICRVIVEAVKPNEANIPKEKQEKRIDRKEVLIAFDETLVSYDSSWTETSRADAVPFEPNQFDILYFNNKVHKIIDITNQDAGDGGVWSALIRG